MKTISSKTPLLGALAFSLLVPSVLVAQHEIFQNVPLNQITPEGWQKNFLIKQRDGLTGHLDTLCEPFNQGGWLGDKSGLKAPFYKRTNSKGVDVLCWEPFEQTGYYYDGVLRAGLLLQDDFLVKKANEQIYGTIAQASPQGVMADAVPDRWPHVVFFRSFMAAYEATRDKKVLEALEKHYANDSFSLAGARNILNIEQLLWLYRQTGKKEYLERPVKLYEAMASRKSDRLVNKFDDLRSDERQDIHGVTFLEMLKLPVLLYMATGETRYLDAARNGYRKLDKFHMLANGITSSEEGLSDKRATSAYETCDISDYAWTTGYMLQATGEVEWADRIERDILNAGMASVTQDFETHNYFAAMNQVVSAIGSCTSPIMGQAGGASNMAYAQRQMPFCCTGNVNRFFPIYVGLQWLVGKDGALVKTLYGPSSFVHKIGDKTIKLREESAFPFSETVTIKVDEGKATFPLQFRIPTWAKKPKVAVNGVEQIGVESGKFFTVSGEHKAGDTITLTFPKEVRVREWEMNGAVVDYGPLLFSLPIPAKVEKELLSDWLWSGTPADSKDLFGYNMFPDGKWKYVLALDYSNNHMARVISNPKADPNNPWDPKNPFLSIQMVGLEMPPWAMHYQEYKPHGNKPKQMAPITPPLPPRGSMIMVYQMCEKPEVITLVPYGSTTLRLTVFPFWDVRDIPSFKENQLKYQ